MDSLGCNIGNEIIPLNVSSFSGTPIHIVQWDKDPKCGIYRNMYNFTGKQCVTSSGRYGNVIEYNQNDINCNLPLDDYIPFLGVAMILVVLRKKLKIKAV